jgi:hypothetical protein
MIFRDLKAAKRRAMAAKPGGAMRSKVVRLRWKTQAGSYDSRQLFKEINIRDNGRSAFVNPGVVGCSARE